MPQSMSSDISSFKLYMGDIGLCSFRAGLKKENMGIFDNTQNTGNVNNVTGWRSILAASVIGVLFVLVWGKLKKAGE